MHLVRPLADTPCSRSLPICGRIGVSLSILCSGLLPSGGTSQTNMVLARPCTDPYCSRARVRVGASVCGSLTTCRWTTLQHDRFANSLRPQFLTHANDPNVAWYTLRSAALRLLPSVMLPRYVPYGRAWRCVSTFLSNRAKTLPVCVGSLWHGFHDAVRSHLRAASLFSGPPRCVAPRIAAQAKRRVRTAPQRRGGRDRRWPQRGCGRTDHRFEERSMGASGGLV